MLWWVTQNVLVSGLLAAAAALLCRFGRFSPAVKHALWLLVMVKLVTPPLACYRLPWSVERLVAAWPIETLSGEEPLELRGAAVFVDGVEFVDDVEFGSEADAVAENEMDGRPLIASDWSETADSSFMGTNPNRQREATISPARSRAGLVTSGDAAAATSDAAADRASRLVFVIWLLGSVPLATFQTVKLVRLRLMTRRPAPTPAWLDRLVREAAERLRVAAPAVSVVPRACSPLVYALGRSRLIWPAALNEQLTRAQQEAVLLHELAHLRRRDHWVAWLELAAGWVWWFNPIYWYARQQLRENAELACDAWVVGLLPSGRRTYAQALIEVTEFVSTATAALPALAMGNVARSSLERRLTMILRERISYRVPLAGAVVIGLSLLAVLPGWSHGQAPGLPGGSGEEAPAAEPSLDEGADSAPVAAEQPAGVAESEDTGSNPAADAGAPDRAARFFFENVAVGEPGEKTAEDTPDVAAEAADGDEQRIAALEAKLAGLLAEVQALRGTNGKRAVGGAMRRGGGMGMGPMGPGGGMGRGPMGPGGGMGIGPMGPGGGMGPMGPGGGGGQLAKSKTTTRTGRIGPNTDPSRSGLPADVETLTRARYKLPAATAAALASFIDEYAKAQLEAKYDGETLTVTASREDQLRIASFIELLREQDRPGGSPKMKARRVREVAPELPTDNGSKP